MLPGVLSELEPVATAPHASVQEFILVFQWAGQQMDKVGLGSMGWG